VDFAGKLEGALRGLIEPVGNVSTKFEELAAPISKFVEAIQPGQLRIFELAMRDLNATIGSAFLPVMENFTRGVSQAAHALVPAMEALRPVFDRLSKSLTELVVFSIEGFAEELRKSAPLLNNLADTANVLVQGWKTLVQVLRNVFDSLNKGSDGFKSIFQVLNTWIIKFVQSLIVAAATIANSFGRGDLIKDFLKAVNTPKGEGGAGAGLHDVGLKGLEQISKDLAVAASYAAGGEGGGAPKDPVVDVLSGMDERLKKIIEDGTTFRQWIGLGGKSIWEAMGDALTAKLAPLIWLARTQINAWVQQIIDAIKKV
jgi:hypothetical protein